MSKNVNVEWIPALSGASCGYGRIIQAASNCAIFCHFSFPFQECFQIPDSWWAIRSMRMFFLTALLDGFWKPNFFCSLSKTSLSPVNFPSDNFLFSLSAWIFLNEILLHGLWEIQILYKFGVKNFRPSNLFSFQSDAHLLPSFSADLSFPFFPSFCLSTLPIFPLWKKH